MSLKRKKQKKQRRPSKRPLLSLCMIAKDEAEFLEACLASIEGLVDEIIIVDTGSTDETLSVANKWGARVVRQKWNEDFSFARNRALKEAKGRWILSLDCDEMLARQSHSELRKLLRNTSADAFRLTTRNYSSDSHSEGWRQCVGQYSEEREYAGWFPSTKVRIWKHKNNVCFEGLVHELVEPSLVRLGAEIADCNVPVHHYGYIEKRRDADRYMEAGIRKVKENPQDVRARYELALVYRDAERYKDALIEIDSVLLSLEGVSNNGRLYVEFDQSMLLKADILSRMNLVDEAILTCNSLLEKISDSHQALNNKAVLLEKQGDYNRALACYRAGLDCAPDNTVLAKNVARLATAYSLSVCIIARNEEAHISSCLDSAVAIADQVVVVDTGSSDATVEIAKTYGVVVEKFEWCDDFSAARNFSLQLATGDWILCLDADEFLLAEDRIKIFQTKRTKPEVGLDLTIRNNSGDTKLKRQIRMFPNKPEIRYEFPVDESVTESHRRAGILIKTSDITIQHNKKISTDDVDEKQNYYRYLREEWLKRHEEDWNAYFHYGSVLYTQGDYTTALFYFSQITADCDAKEFQGLFEKSLTLSGRCLLETGDYDAAGNFLEEAVSRRSKCKVAYLSLGDLFVKKGEFTKALKYLRLAESGSFEPYPSFEEVSVDYSIQFFVGQALSSQGDQDGAAKAFQNALDIAPQRTEAKRALSMLSRGVTAADRGLYVKPKKAVGYVKLKNPVVIGANSVKVPKGDVPPKTLSLCMIVRDEEKRLARCLDSAKDLVDEIVIVDTGSRDKTVEIAQKYDAKIGHFEWCDDFAAARNKSIELASSDWILWLDADDILPEESHKPIRDAIDQDKNQAYFFILDDQGYEDVSCLQLRLFPNLPGVHFQMPVHEQVTPSLESLGLQMIQTEIRVQHTGYTTPEVVAAKKDRYLKIMEKWIEKHPEDYMERSHVALTYYSTGRLAEAEEVYRIILEETDCYADRNWIVYTTALLFLGRTYIKMDRLDEALEYLKKAEEVDSKYMLTQLSLAEVYTKLSKPQQVLQHGVVALSQGDQHTFFPIDRNELLYSAHLLCAQAYGELEEWGKAIAEYRAAAEIPISRRCEALGHLFSLFQKLNRTTEAKDVITEALAISPNHPEHLFNAGVICMQGADFDRAKDYFEKSVQFSSDPTNPLMNLGYVLKVCERFSESEEAYREVLKLNQQNVDAKANLVHLMLDQERYDETSELLSEIRDLDKSLLDIELSYLFVVIKRSEDSFGSRIEILKGIAECVPTLQIDLKEITSSEGMALLLGQLGIHLMSSKLFRCAELAILSAIELAGGVIDYRRILSEVYIEQRAYWKAVDHLEIILKVVPDDARSFQLLGDCYSALGVSEAADLCYSRAEVA
ncbi:MAG: glycosyltransferase [Candidatus Latescibacterota bacterium]|nr:glycosyltransferase [Candidatus Latescibacterota bacterium]